ncbi:BON domain-containing protein [Kangiella sp.]|uniref:BON domain-containing protein n=1 Tax=Kangiella sp. TaxID=1920245 RepID=UPI0019B00516|nr:BON domain-containing protein [Kangiella sp.]MBD3653993.1 BON domain-containing protein [Kangiella sp.]
MLTKKSLRNLFLIPALALGLSACTTFGTVAEDSSIQGRVKDRINPILEKNQPNAVDVVSHNLYVLIYGQVPNEAVIAQISEAIKGVPEMKKAFNEVRVGNPEDVSTVSDVWITTKVKSSLAAEKGLDSKRIKVITEDNEVFLMGMVTREEGDKAALVARNISGVKKVVKIFEYIN